MASNATSRAAGESTSDESESVWLVGPIEPPTKRGVRAVKASAAPRATAAAARHIS